jgi:hypothetical protein
VQFRRIAAGAAMVALLGFACMGVVFTVKLRQAKPESHPAAEIVASPNVNQPAFHSPAPHPKPKVVPPVVSPPAPVPPVVPVVEPVLVEAGPEELAVAPRNVEPTPAAKSVPEPAFVNDRPRPAANGEPTREPDASVTNIPDLPKEKPIVEGPKKLSDTVPAIDPRLETFGTRIGFHRNFNEAIEAAKKDKDNLVMVVHYAGLFENGSFAADAVEQFRGDCLLNDEVASIVNRNFICSATRIGPSRNIDGRNTGSVATYFCLSNGAVLHAIPGPVSAEAFLREVNWLLETRKTAAEEYQKNPSRYAATFKKAHMERYFDSAPDEITAPAVMPPMQPKIPFPRFPFPPKLPLGGFGGPLDPSPPMPEQPKKLPAKLPSEIDAQTKVHWLLARQPLAELKSIYRRVYSEFLRESMTP